jgi:glutaredoxin
LSKPRVVIYTRPDCHLCDDAREAIRSAQCSDQYTLEEVNIETDSQLWESYKYDIPVIMINGVEAFRHRLTAGEFKARMLQS